MINEDNYSDEAVERLMAIRPEYHQYFKGMSEKQAQKLHDEHLEALEVAQEKRKKDMKLNNAITSFMNEERRKQGLKPMGHVLSNT